jgi:hypothetical protein
MERMGSGRCTGVLLDSDVGRGIDVRCEDLIGGLRVSGGIAVAVIALKLSEALSKAL